MPASARTWTVEEVREMQEEDRAWPRYELIDGELIVTPGPEIIHAEAFGDLLFALGQYLKGQRGAKVLFSSSDLELVPGSLVQPDVFVYPRSTEHRVREWNDIKRLLVAIEITSATTGQVDRGIKRRFYARSGVVAEYWVVDVDARVIERTRGGAEQPEILDRTLEWHFDGASEPFVLDVQAFFAGVHDVFEG